MGALHEAEPLTFRPYREGDEAGVVRLFGEVFGREMSLAEWRWKYLGAGGGRAYAVVAVTPDGTVVGHYGGTPVSMVRSGEAIRGISLGDVMIRPKYRGLKTFRRLTHAMEEFMHQERFLMVYGFPNEMTLMLPAEKLRLYDRVEDVFDLTKTAVFRNGTDRFLFRLFPISFDHAGIDDLWQEMEPEMRLAVVRDSRFLEWRYGTNPVHRYEIWGMGLRWSAGLKGAVVLRREPGRLLVMDVIAGLRRLPAMLAKVENLAVSTGIGELRIWLPPYLHAFAGQQGYTRGAIVTTIPCTTHPGFLTKQDIQGNFFYTMGDTDFL